MTCDSHLGVTVTLLGENMSHRKWIGLTLVAFVFATAAACNFVPRTQLPSSAFPTENAYTEVPRVSLEDAKAAFANGTAIFIDVRSSAAFADSHIPGALSIPGSDLENHLDQLDPNQWIITYCT